jgi:hypothetical protein
MIIAVTGALYDSDDKFVSVKYAGKDTVLNLIKEHVSTNPDLVNKFKIKHVNFADKLKECVRQLYPLITLQHVNDPIKKEEIIPEYKMSARTILEVFGTTLCRDMCQRPNIWIDHVMEQIWKEFPLPVDNDDIKKSKKPRHFKILESVFNVNGAGIFNYHYLNHLQGLVSQGLQPQSILENANAGVFNNEYEKNLQTCISQGLLPPIDLKAQEQEEEEQNLQCIFMISDVRFPNEYQRLVNIAETIQVPLHVIQVKRRLTREQDLATFDLVSKLPISRHATNVLYDEIVPTVVMENNGDLHELKIRVEEFCSNILKIKCKIEK